MARVTGQASLLGRLRALASPDFARKLHAAVYAGADIIAKDAQRSITEGSISGSGHVASNPGEPPNADTRVLDSSIQVVMVGQARAEIEAGAPYAVALEFGTANMEERPFLRPAVARKRTAATGVIMRVVRDTVRRRR